MSALKEVLGSMHSRRGWAGVLTTTVVLCVLVPLLNLLGCHVFLRLRACFLCRVAHIVSASAAKSTWVLMAAAPVVQSNLDAEIPVRVDRAPGSCVGCSATTP